MSVNRLVTDFSRGRQFNLPKWCTQ